MEQTMLPSSVLENLEYFMLAHAVPKKKFIVSGTGKEDCSVSREKWDMDKLDIFQSQLLHKTQAYEMTGLGD